MSASDQFVEAIAEAVARKLATSTHSAPQEQPRLMNIKAAAKYLGRTESSVRGMLSTGELPSNVVRRFSGRIFIERRELDAWVSAQ